ncbi:MAG: serine/threonine-protein kinase, partial [Nannocystaceae bacterium]
MTDSAHIVRIYDVGVVGDEVFLAMELIRGQTLTAWLGAERRGWREIVRIFVDAARGLAAAHEVGLVHRDFKPDNVLISEDGRVRVADFGLAREEHGGDAAWNPGTRGLLVDTLTATGVLMGTPMYMSPEQHRGEAAGPASDIFSFAVALHEGLYGLRPFAGDTMAELARNVEAGALVATPTDRGVPGWVDAVVRRCLSPKTEDRFASFDALIAALDRDPTGARRRWLFGVGVTAALVGLSGLALAQRSIEPCEGGEELIAAAWGDGGEEALEARL